MAERIVQLGAGDYDEAMDFLDLVFAEHRAHDFRRLHPLIYHPTDAHMRCNYVVRRSGRIAAIVGLFPITLHMGDTPLRTAGIGSVSVHPDHRGQGLMRLLMDRVMRGVERGGYPLAYLGGDRQRYAYWGFETAGVELDCTVHAGNVKHAVGESARSITLEAMEDDGAALAAVKRLHDAQPIRCERPLASFGRSLRVWDRRGLAGHDAQGNIVAYACGRAGHDQVVDLCAATDRDAAAYIGARVLAEQRTLHLSLPMLPMPWVRRVMDLADQCSIHTSGNWRIFDWPRVIGALVRLRHRVSALPAGAVVIGAGDAVFEIRIDGSVTCEPCDGAPDVAADEPTMLRLLCGPLPPSLVTDLPARARVLDSWCPLPLCLPTQDRV